jgi:hypothetical protein
MDTSPEVRKRPRIALQQPATAGARAGLCKGFSGGSVPRTTAKRARHCHAAPALRIAESVQKYTSRSDGRVAGSGRCGVPVATGLQPYGGQIEADYAAGCSTPCCRLSQGSEISRRCIPARLVVTRGASSDETEQHQGAEAETAQSSLELSIRQADRRCASIRATPPGGPRYAKTVAS